MIILFLILALLPASEAMATHPPKSIIKAEKRALKYFKEFEIKKEPCSIDHSEFFKEEADTVFRLLETDGALRGFLVLSSAMGRFEEFDFMMVYTADLQLADLNILVYRSEFGYQISAKGWLKQFLLQPSGTAYIYGKNIDAISGATISGSSLTNNINRLNKLIGSLEK